MKKIAIVYWSGTGNTESMAEAVARGVKQANAEVTLFKPAEFSPEKVMDYDAIAFGCPSMGSEQLEDSEFEPMFIGCEPQLKGKRIGLFGSYGWGDGEWMRNWEASCKEDEADLIAEGVICNEAPDDEAIASCQALGAALVR